MIQLEPRILGLVPILSIQFRLEMIQFSEVIGSL